MSKTIWLNSEQEKRLEKAIEKAEKKEDWGSVTIGSIVYKSLGLFLEGENEK